VTGIKKKSQYGTLTVKNDVAASYNEKEKYRDNQRSFFVLEPEIFKYLKMIRSAYLRRILL